MVFRSELEELRVRKEVLLAQCDIARGMVDLECTQISDSFSILDRPSQWLAKLKPFLPVLAPVAGFVFAKNWKRAFSWSGRFLLVGLAKKLFRF